MAAGDERGFTLVELMIAMTILALLAASIYGVIAIGARSAAAGERRTEQARRLRIATGLVVRQLRSTVPLTVAVPDENTHAVPYFLGQADRVDFITGTPQLANSSGIAIVSYWQEDDVFMMSEIPFFAAAAFDSLEDIPEEIVTSTPLLYDVRSVHFSYRRQSLADHDWQNEWDAAEEENLPAAVLVEIDQSIPGGLHWVHEVPVFVGAMNELAGQSDFQGRHAHAGRHR